MRIYDKLFSIGAKLRGKVGYSDLLAKYVGQFVIFTSLRQAEDILILVDSVEVKSQVVIVKGYIYDKDHDNNEIIKISLDPTTITMVWGISNVSPIQMLEII